MATDAYTGLRRRKQTPWSVKFGDALASRTIAVGGIGTIAAILLVVVVLLSSALPLFAPPKFGDWHQFAAERFEKFGVDENGVIFWGMLADGTVESLSIVDGQRLSSSSLALPADTSVSSSFLSIDGSTLAVGLSDGTIRTAEIVFETKLLSPKSVSDLNLSETNPFVIEGGFAYEWLDATGVRRTTLQEIEWSEPIRIGEGAVTSIDFVPDSSANRLSTSSKSFALAVIDNQLHFATNKSSYNRLTRKSSQSVEVVSCEMQDRTSAGDLKRISLLNGNTQAIAVWENGTLDRYAIGQGKVDYVESQSAIIGNATMTSAAPLLGRQDMMCGLSDGKFQGWMVTRDPSSGDEDGARRLTLVHEVTVGDAPLLSINSSRQNHLAVVCDGAKQVSLIYVTTNALLDSYKVDMEAPATAALDPSGDTLIVAGDGSYGLCRFELDHPESSWLTYFGKVWYEGHDEPKYIWQSSAGTVESEIKLSLVPLVFGTLKATVYAMLISVPLAIMAAIYTSEFLSPSARSRVKPIVELMASLPSVVLGYVAALVVASYLQENLMMVLLAFMVVPLSFVVAGNLWNLLPIDGLVRLQWLRLPAMALCLPIAYWGSRSLAPVVESTFFAGDIVRWLSGEIGAATGGWMLLSTPVLAMCSVFIFFGPLAEQTRGIAISRTPRSYAMFSLLRLCIVVALVIFSSWLVGFLLTTFGLDPRDSLFGSYQDRNALLVGGALGFCVIPIIYTISDDALQAVPKQLRSASLGCGATPWQTTIRVVVPSAMSGLFSAVMIGLGRAVGETMVVLMAAGNTPVMEWNPFNGFRTLSATLATELPEAAKGSTHFRTLFLAALLLFVMTLVANTLAEFVRIRFRKRASQL